MNHKEIQTKYIEKFIEAIESDKKMVMIYVTFSLAILVLSFKEVAFSDNEMIQKLITENSWKKIVFLISMLLFSLASFCHFSYYRKLHLRLYKITRSIKHSNSNFEDDNPEFWKKNGWIFKLGLYLFWIAIIAYLLFFSSIII